MRKLSLFSGIGGIDLAAHWAGMETMAFCEREPFPQKVLRKHWPEVPIYDDVCTLTREVLERDGIITADRTIDIISAGYPCQPFSHAGKRRGEEDDRHLWPEVKRLLEEIRPRWFLGENVAGHITLGLDIVLADLESIGYACEAIVIPSAAVGAPHRRDRVFILGYTEHDGSYGAEIRRSIDKTSHDEQEGTDETCESKGASRSECNENVADHTGEGLPQWRQSRIAATGTETEPRMESEFERCSEVMANTDSIRNDSSGECEANGNRQKRMFEWRQSQFRFSNNSKNVANSTSIRQSRSWEPFKSINQTQSRDGQASESINVRIGEERSIESILGRKLDGLSDWLDGYRWPAALGQEQYEWEPPRVAIGIKDRVGRLKALGNAVNPVQIYPFLAAIKQIDDLIKGTTRS